MKFFKLTLILLFAYLASFGAFYLIAAAGGSFITMSNMFDVTEWQDVSRLILLVFSVMPVAYSIIYFHNHLFDSEE